jgi:hypothetical protein
VTHPAQQKLLALQLRARRCSTQEISRITGVGRATLYYWFRYPDGERKVRPPSLCVRCGAGQTMSARDYAYLLGLYLGDGSLNLMPRDVWRLRVVQDARYRQLVSKCADTIRAVCGHRSHFLHQPGCIAISAYWKHWIHVFPQHGPGRKHTRAIVLESWQQEIVAAQAREFLAGLIHSDGSRSINSIVARSVSGLPVHYWYPRYFFSNNSDDIRRLFTDTCDLLGVHWTQANAHNIAVSRRRDVAVLDTFTGAKS